MRESLPVIKNDVGPHRLADRLRKFDFALRNHKKDGVRSDSDMETDPEESNFRVAQKRMLEQIVAIPATLYLPTSIVAELNEICETLGYTPEQLVIEALRGQIGYWNEFYKHVMTLPVEPQDLVWPKDPVFCLACVTTVHIINNFARCSHDPVALAQLKADAPTEWSFSSLEEGEEIDDADWWKSSH
jgi:hypothetical protein